MELTNIQNLKEQIEKQKEEIKSAFIGALGNTEYTNLFVTPELEVFLEISKLGNLTKMRIENIEELGFLVKSVSMKNKLVVFMAKENKKRFAIGDMIDYIRTLDIETRSNIVKAISPKIIEAEQ